MTTRPLNVLFLCTGNSARSILAESLLNSMGGGRFRAWSAGSRPTGRIHPMALELLARRGLETENLRSKSWDEFRAPGAPRMDYVLTLCGADECPVWPGDPIRSHWRIPDPAAASGGEVAKRHAFTTAFGALQSRILVFASLPLRQLSRALQQKRINELGQLSMIGGEDPTSLADRIRAASRPLRALPRRRAVKDLLQPRS